MTRRPVAGGTGSNQYATKGRSKRALSVDEIRDRVEVEKVAYAFTGARTASSSERQQSRRVRAVDKQAALAAHPDSQIRSELAAKPTTVPEVLAVLAEDTFVDVRRVVAKNPNTPPTTLRHLALIESDLAVSSQALRNPSCPEDALRDAVRGHYAEGAVATNPSAPPDLLAVIAEDKDKWGRPEQRHHLTRNPTCPGEILATIANACRPNDPHQAVEALKHPNCPPELLSRFSSTGADAYDEMFRAAIAANPSCPADRLRRLAGSAAIDIRDALAANPACPPDVLATLVHDSNTSVRIHAIRNPSCPLEAVRSRGEQETTASVTRAITGTVRARAR